jgi:hypothetical protein
MENNKLYKAMNKVILSFCENLAELGCPKDEPDADMWFRYLSPKDQLKVCKKMVKIMERDRLHFSTKNASKKNSKRNKK